jgi:hypothetical protein
MSVGTITGLAIATRGAAVPATAAMLPAVGALGPEPVLARRYSMHSWTLWRSPHRRGKPLLPEQPQHWCYATALVFGHVHAYQTMSSRSAVSAMLMVM